MTVKYVIRLLPVFFLTFINLSTGFEKEKELEIKILEKIATDITKKEKVKVYLVGYPENLVISYSKKLKTTDTCKNSDVIILKEKSEIPCKGKIILTTNYYLLLNYPDAVGAFYWKKGRPHLVFIKERLERKNIKLPPDYDKFIIELSDRIK
ncbi:hypothetical protein [Persephonella sp.]